MTIGITRNLNTWRLQEHYVERLMDNAAYTAAHPDDTLILAGNARLANSIQNAETSLLAIGMVQTIQISQTKPSQPVQAIGSGRSFFISGKAQGSGTIGRLFVNGRNLLRVLYHNARQAELPVNQFDDIAAFSATSQFYINLDSELYLIPFGLGAIFRTKAHDFVGGFYAELCMINNWAIAFQAGPTAIAEQVSFMFDRLLPFGQDTVLQPGVPRATLDAVLGFSDQITPDTGSLGSAVDDTNLGTATVPEVITSA